jgi:hypothetical protein
MTAHPQDRHPATRDRTDRTSDPYRPTVPAHGEIVRFCSSTAVFRPQASERLTPPVTIGSTWETQLRTAVGPSLLARSRSHGAVEGPPGVISQPSETIRFCDTRGRGSEGPDRWPLPCEASAATTQCSPAPCSAPHRPSSSVPPGGGDVLLRMASRGKCADRLLTGVAAARTPGPPPLRNPTFCRCPATSSGPRAIPSPTCCAPAVR